MVATTSVSTCLPALGKKASKITALIVVLGLLVATDPLFPAPRASATNSYQTGVSLRASATNSVLAGSTSTNAGTVVGSSPTHLTGDLGCTPVRPSPGSRALTTAPASSTA